MTPRVSFDPSRRAWLRRAAWSAAVVGTAGVAPAAIDLAVAAQAYAFGPKVPDVKPVQTSEHVWSIVARDAFPTPDNQGFFSNTHFILTPKGVVVFDTGSSLQIGQMCLRMLRTVTDKPVIAVFNSHFHGDHWLGNQAYVDAFGPKLPIYALPGTRRVIAGVEGNAWRENMLKWTNNSSLGTKVVAPTLEVRSGDVFEYGGITLKAHHYGKAHTPDDLCIEIVQDKAVCAGDIMMNHRIANMEDGSFLGTLAYYDKLEKATGARMWLPGHGAASADILAWNREIFQGIFDGALKAAREMAGPTVAKEYVLADPRVAKNAGTTAGFEKNIGKFASLAYLEAEQQGS